jgi:hypothetical protein
VNVKKALLGLAAALLVPVAALGQTSPFLPDPLFRHLVNELSGDRAYENVRYLSHFHRTGSSKDFFRAAEWIRKAAEEAGLDDVKLVRQKGGGPAWSCTSGEAWLLEPEEIKLAAYAEVAVSIADMSRTTHVNAELVDVGAGASDKDYEGRDVKGKVVLASGGVGTVHREAVWKRGALGVISYQTNRPEAFDAPDQVAWASIGHQAKDVSGVKDGTPGTFGVMLSPRRGRWLQKRLADAGKPLKVKVDIDASFAEPPEQAFVEGFIKGSEVKDQQIVLTAHIQEEMTSANDDGSGCGNLLEIARALSRLVKEGKIPKPRRDIRFWWVNEFNSEEQFFRENPKEPRKMLLNLNQDMVGARQSWGGRVQYVSRLPWSVPHVLDDVMESVLGAVRDGNTSYLTNRGTQQPVPFTKEVTAVKGSREPFQARMVPYFDSTDHHAFVPSPVGVPGTSLTNWPDEYIHSTGDDLENIDATQLERNAVVVAGVALYFAGFSEDQAAPLAAYVAARGRSRAAADVAIAMAHVAQAEPAAREAAYRTVRGLVRSTYRREIAALASIRRLGARGRTLEYLTQATKALEDSEEVDLSDLERAWGAMTGKNPPNIELSKDEKAMAQKVFTPVSDPGTWTDAIRKAKGVDGIHPMMRFEIYNFADGRRSAWEIYESVAAEALSAGEWYYGTVKPSDVLTLLERAAEAGAFTVKAAK